MTTDPALAGTLQLFDSLPPALPVDDYAVVVTQTDPTGTSYSASQGFSVRGPRYALPVGEVSSTMPPSGSRGAFGQNLPHVVLRTAGLPWERDAFAASGGSPSGLPWVALLLLDDDDIVATSSIAAAELFAAHPTPTLRWPDLTQEWYETDLSSTVCSVVDITATAFANLVPCRADLPYLAHVRQVGVEAKTEAAVAASPSGQYAVVVANRFPAVPISGSTQRSTGTAHLVSLEGFADLIGETSTSQPPQPVRMISLAHWTFTCLSDAGETFSELLTNMLTAPDGTKSNLAYALPVPATASTTYTSAMLALGYVPLSYQTRPGDQTFAWYRGPFSPVPVAPFLAPDEQGADDPAGWQPLPSASAALVFDPTHGLFDVSYGVAWETGRLLALADRAFAQALVRWQRDGHDLLDLILERAAQIPALQSFDPNDPISEQDLLDLLQADAVTASFASSLLTELSTQTPDLAAATTTATFDPDASTTSPPPNPQTLRELLEQTDIQAAVQQICGQELGAIDDWLARLYLLDGVPFEDLVPNAALLPIESTRCFYVDPNWLVALVEGALSIAIHSSRDQLFQDLMKAVIWDSTLAAVQQLRANLLGTPTSLTGPSGPIAGMLLRSAVVSGWPGLEVRAFDDTGDVIPLLRMANLSSDLLLCLWPAVPARIQIAEPSEGLAFGVEDDGFTLRQVQGSYGMPTKQHLAPAPDANRVIAMASLAAAIAGQLGGRATLSPRDFSLQLVKVPERATIGPNQPAEN